MNFVKNNKIYFLYYLLNNINYGKNQLIPILENPIFLNTIVLIPTIKKIYNNKKINNYNKKMEMISNIEILKYNLKKNKISNNMNISIENIPEKNEEKNLHFNKSIIDKEPTKKNNINNMDSYSDTDPFYDLQDDLFESTEKDSNKNIENKNNSFTSIIDKETPKKNNINNMDSYSDTDQFDGSKPYLFKSNEEDSNKNIKNKNNSFTSLNEEPTKKNNINNMDSYSDTDQFDDLEYDFFTDVKENMIEFFSLENNNSGIDCDFVETSQDNNKEQIDNLPKNGFKKKNIDFESSNREQNAKEDLNNLNKYLNKSIKLPTINETAFVDTKLFQKEKSQEEKIKSVNNQTIQINNQNKELKINDKNSSNNQPALENTQILKKQQEQENTQILKEQKEQEKIATFEKQINEKILLSIKQKIEINNFFDKNTSNENKILILKKFSEVINIPNTEILKDQYIFRIKNFRLNKEENFITDFFKENKININSNKKIQELMIEIICYKQNIAAVNKFILNNITNILKDKMSFKEDIIHFKTLLNSNIEFIEIIKTDISEFKFQFIKNHKFITEVGKIINICEIYINILNIIENGYPKKTQQQEIKTLIKELTKKMNFEITEYSIVNEFNECMFKFLINNNKILYLYLDEDTKNNINKIEKTINYMNDKQKNQLINIFTQYTIKYNNETQNISTFFLNNENKSITQKIVDTIIANDYKEEITINFNVGKKTYLMNLKKRHLKLPNNDSNNDSNKSIIFESNKSSIFDDKNIINIQNSHIYDDKKNKSIIFLDEKTDKDLEIPQEDINEIEIYKLALELIIESYKQHNKKSLTFFIEQKKIINTIENDKEINEIKKNEFLKIFTRYIFFQDNLEFNPLNELIINNETDFDTYTYNKQNKPLDLDKFYKELKNGSNENLINDLYNNEYKKSQYFYIEKHIFSQNKQINFHVEPNISFEKLINDYKEKELQKAKHPMAYIIDQNFNNKSKIAIYNILEKEPQMNTSKMSTIKENSKIYETENNQFKEYEIKYNFLKKYYPNNIEFLEYINDEKALKENRLKLSEEDKKILFNIYSNNYIEIFSIQGGRLVLLFSKAHVNKKEFYKYIKYHLENLKNNKDKKEPFKIMQDFYGMYSQKPTIIKYTPIDFGKLNNYEEKFNYLHKIDTNNYNNNNIQFLEYINDTKELKKNGINLSQEEKINLLDIFTSNYIKVSRHRKNQNDSIDNNPITKEEFYQYIKESQIYQMKQADIQKLKNFKSNNQINIIYTPINYNKIDDEEIFFE